MYIKKKKVDGMDSFNDYEVGLSYGQIIAIRNALEKDHSDPLSDEILAELNYYLQNVPGPGEDGEAFKAERNAAKKTKGEAGEEVPPDEIPPSDTELEAGGGLPPPPEEGEEGLGGEEFGGGELGGEEPFAGEEGPGEAPKLSPMERDVIDRAMPTGRPSPVGGRLPPPPAE